ncbi:hypothetical protein [Polystyrenella longa]|nr:hypothetical protein [Polystyrenella longa]
MEKLTPVNQPPLTFVEGDSTWTKEKEILPVMEVELATIVNHRPSLTDNPRMTGNPVLYSTSDGRIRFYWLTIGIGEMEWLYVEFNEGGFNTSDEGTGWEDTSG